MSNNFKKIIVSACIAATLFSVSSLASNFAYNLTLNAGTGYQYTAKNPKNDDEQMAYVTISSRSNDVGIRTQIINDVGTICTDEKVLTVDSTYGIPYKVKTKIGQEMRLGMHGGSSYVIVKGRWNS